MDVASALKQETTRAKMAECHIDNQLGSETDTNASDVSYLFEHKQNKLEQQTPYTAVGSASKIPQITTNELGQVTNITEIDNPSGTAVNDATLTIQRNGTKVASFTANQSTDVTANITVPTVYNSKMTIKNGETELGSFTGNQSAASSVDISSALPAVNDATLTIQRNGTKVASFTANQSTDVTANITVPTVYNNNMNIKANGATVGTFTGNASAAKTVDISQAVFNIAHPVGEVYVQFPGQSDPATVYAISGVTATWTEVTSTYAGLFFRAAGGNAGDFGTDAPVTQETAIITHAHSAPKHTHNYIDYYAASGGVGNLGSSSVKSASKTRTTEEGTYGDGTEYSYASYGLTSAKCWQVKKTSVSSIPIPVAQNTDDNETRPVNTAIKIWKRTA